MAGLFSGDEPAIEGIDTVGWCAALALEPPTSEAGRPALDDVSSWFDGEMLPAIPRILQWVANASIDELVKLTPPASPLPFSPSTSESTDRKLREQYRWAVDHFAKTFFREWRTTSLHYELRWLDGDLLPPCPDELMRDREVPREKVIEEIAQRAVYRSRPHDPGAALVAEMSRHAYNLLRQERYREASAVFEFGTQQRPGDSEIRNNFGFCLIPIDPREALEHLKTAANMGYKPSATNTHNQMCCYVSIGRPLAALNIAEVEWKKPWCRRQGAYLWRRTANGQWQLFDSEDPLMSVAELAREVAQSEGWKEQEELWRSNSASELRQL